MMDPALYGLLVAEGILAVVTLIVAGIILASRWLMGGRD